LNSHICSVLVPGACGHNIRGSDVTLKGEEDEKDYNLRETPWHTNTCTGRTRESLWHQKPGVATPPHSELSHDGSNNNTWDEALQTTLQTYFMQAENGELG